MLQVISDRVELDNPSEARRSFASTAFIDDVNAELEAEAAHYLSWQVREAESAPLVIETAIELLEQTFPQNYAIGVSQEISKSAAWGTKITFNVHLQVMQGWLVSSIRSESLEAAVAEVIEKGNEAYAIKAQKDADRAA